MVNAKVGTCPVSVCCTKTAPRPLIEESVCKIHCGNSGKPNGAL